MTMAKRKPESDLPRTVESSAIGATMTVDEIYEGVTFAAAPAADDG